ncbi:TonB-dependent receptor [Glaciecola sp. MH2013]|uniref:TonB-dependent receptor n=1 Tax=Glaciecola sp. MH2013 TaxID=2785524 RepID=UPI00189D9A0F|nr:TonB-dependent receptor [Glaciecola sp. MH2013]MBF7073874.1 TonB-dependent receptor [Glaciecola sp. MH2013]
MKSKALISLSVLAALSANLQAKTVSGQVKDQGGLPLTKGKVQIMGTNKSVQIDENGRFTFSGVKPGKIELHVASSQHIHSSTELDVPEAGLVDVNIQVVNSSIEIFDVTASAFHASTIESAAPVSVLAGDELRKKQASTLGDTLKNEVGVHSTFYGNVASSPIIRGLDGPRVLITQNGLDSGDASRVGPDHIVATDSSTATQIEILRGPATLFYGSGAIGGVVNVVDQRIPDNNDWEGELLTERNTNNSEESFAGSLKGGSGDFAFNVQAFYRDADDYRIPGYAENEEAHDDEHHDDDHDDDHDDMHEEDHEEHDDEHQSDEKGIVENSSSRSKGFTLGGSYLMDNGFVGFSFEHMSSVYGIPGHAHGHEDEHDEDHDEEHGDEHEGEHDDEMEEIVKGDLQQNRYQLISQHQISSDWLSAINTSFAYTNYTHAEIENGEIGTVFANDSQEARVELIHQPMAGWRGGLSVHYKDSDFEAIGEEAFTPPSRTRSLGVGIIEEQHFGDVLVQLGARIERVRIEVPSLQIGEIELEGELHEDHDDDHMDDDMHGHSEGHSDIERFSGGSSSRNFTPMSLSAGAVWDFAEGYNLGVSYVHAQRAPSNAELYSFGPHIGTSTYELGALFNVDEDGDITFNSGGVEEEESNNIDISLRKFSGNFGFVLNAFYNSVDNYYYAAETGFIASDEHEEEHADEHMDEDEHEHSEEGLPVFVFDSVDADLYGFEAQLNWQATSSLRLRAQGDMIRTRLDNTENGRFLPRTPPTRFGVSANYVLNEWQAELSVNHHFEQDRTAEFETSTDAYTLVDLDLNYQTAYQNVDLTVFLKGRNLADEEARVHTSFLKDLTPVQGRSFIFGVRANF